ncbi:MAG: hypothetical protein KDA69_15540, partial [Planctomycetaceae bacterium]|nr:hypothetical protein [Planctomycetaceae bacterium]
KSTDLVRLVSGYKGTNNQDNEMAVRNEMLEIFTQASGVQSQSDEEWNRAVQSADDFEALMCAYVAWYHSQNSTVLSGFESGDQVELEFEGSAVLPASSWCNDEGGRFQ